MVSDMIGFSAYHKSFGLHRASGQPCRYCSSPLGNEIALYLLSCSHVSLARCGRILPGVATHYRAGHIVSAVEQAAFAREKLDRSRYLEEQWREGVRGTSLSIEEVNKGLNDHLMNQDWGQHRVVQEYCGKGMMRKMLKVMHRPPSESNKSPVPQQESDKSAERGTESNSPWQCEKEDVRRFIQDVIDEYRLRLDRVQRFEVLNLADPELAHAYARLEDCISLLLPPVLD
jgi:hypothetical protein